MLVCKAARGHEWVGGHRKTCENFGTRMSQLCAADPWKIPPSGNNQTVRLRPSPRRNCSKPTSLRLRSWLPGPLVLPTGASQQVDNAHTNLMQSVVCHRGARTEGYWSSTCLEWCLWNRNTLVSLPLQSLNILFIPWNRIKFFIRIKYLMDRSLWK